MKLIELERLRVKIVGIVRVVGIVVTAENIRISQNCFTRLPFRFPASRLPGLAALQLKAHSPQTNKQ